MIDEERSLLFTIEFKLDKQGNFIMDTFRAYNGFIDLPMSIQHELINKVMTELGERPTIGVGGYISCN